MSRTFKIREDTTNEGDESFFFNIQINNLNVIQNMVIRDTSQKPIYTLEAIQPDDVPNTFYIDGNFESEKYFVNCRKNLIQEFSLVNENKYLTNQFYKEIKNENAVSICIRQNRFSERGANYSNVHSKEKSKTFVKDTINYIKKAEVLIESKISNPKYYLWSDDFKNLREYFPKQKYTFVINNEDKILNDFFLLKSCKYFIVGPTTFHWWGAWLSDHEDKICLRPNNINPSNNIDFWPDSWISI